MITTNRHTHEITSTLEGDTVDMEIAQDALHHIISILINQYSDPKVAIVREYSANALDSHIQAGCNLPIEVTTPTKLAPFLRIKDYGVGLDKADIINVYSKYGASTKTATNAQTGALGIGGKSAFAYTTQFTIVGIKGGIKTAISASLDTNGVGRMKMLSEVPTDEANGVTIIIPTKEGDDFQSETASLFKYWPEGTVLVDGEEPVRVAGLKITDDILLVDSTERDRYGSIVQQPNVIVMGACAYKLDTSHLDFGLRNRYGVVARVPIGSCHIAPSRDALNYTDDTMSTLNHLKDALDQGLADAVKLEIEAAPSMPEALKVALKWRSVLPQNFLRQNKLSYGKHEIPDEILAPENGERFMVARGEEEKDYYGKRVKVGYHSRMHAIDLTMVSDAIWVYDFQRSFTPVAKKKLWKWCDDNGRSYPKNFIMCGTKPASPWIPPENMIPWEPVEALKLPRVNSVTGRTTEGRIPGSYDMYLNVGQGPDLIEDLPGDEIDTDMPIRYVVGDVHHARQAAKQLAQVEDEFILVFFTSNREAKFCRLFPSARLYRRVMQEYAGEFMSFLSPRERSVLQMYHAPSNRNALAVLDTVPYVGILDPHIKAAKLAKDWNPSYRCHLSGMLEVFQGFGIEFPMWTNPLDKYPLFAEGDTWSIEYNARREGRSPRKALAHHRQHQRVYLNAAYQAFHQDTTSQEETQNA